MPELNVSRKTIRKLFGEMQNKKFIIPDYQRPYKWDVEKCENLWDDITNFHRERKDSDEYFLGAIVTCKGDSQSNTIEIIDGQQRITSLFLLLRAFYKKLEMMDVDENITGLKIQIEPCLWDADPISTKVKDNTKIHIESKVATEKDNDIFHRILKDGEFSTDGKDLYNSNYSFFFKKCENFATTQPMNWQQLCLTILDKCIVLPIECENLDTALTIFSTLNDRGMPLSDSDIFKAQIYKTKGSNDKNKFTNDWKDLTEKVEDANITLDDLFRYYSHIIRAKNTDKTKEIGLRKFYYAKADYSELKGNDLINDLKDLADFWISVNKRESKINNVEKINVEAQKYLHCLQYYPNDFWKYITSVYFYKNKDSNDFINTFPEFLKKLTAFLFSKFIVKPTVNAIKDDIYQGIIDVYRNSPLKFEIHLHEDFKTSISNAAFSKIAKGIILLHAYQNSYQKTIIPEKFEIEHIFPRNWQDTNYQGWNKEDANVYLEKFGNKVAIEKKINIQAGNGYFGKKKGRYSESKIEDVHELSCYSKNDWQKDDIEERERQIVEVLLNFFKNNLMLETR